MNRRQFTLGLVSAAAFTPAQDALAQQCSTGKVGELREVNAWVNRQGPGRPSFYITGRIVTPTPCYGATIKWSGDKKTNPPIGMFKVSVSKRGGACIDCIAEVPFRYEKKNYAGNYETVEVSSDQDSKTVKVQIVS
jgi:hypothetical protein